MIIRATRSELRKFFSTRMWWGMAIACAVLALLFTVGFSFVYTGTMNIPEGGPKPPPASQAQLALNLYTGVLFAYCAILLVIGVLIIGQEYRHKTITSTLLATPARGAVVGSKILAVLIIGAFYALIIIAVGVTGAAIVISSKGLDPFPSAEVPRGLALMLLLLGLWGLFGLGLGVLIRNQFAAVIVGIALVFTSQIASPILRVLEWSPGHAIAPYTPTEAGHALIGLPHEAPGTYLTWWQGGLELLALGVVAAVVGWLITTRKDVS